MVIAGSIVALAWASRYVRAGSIEATRNLFADPPDIRDWTPNPAFTFVRQHLPPSAKVLLLNTNHGFFLDRDYVADSFFEASQLNEQIVAAGDPQGVTRFVRGLGITHVLADRAPWVKFPPMLWQYLDDPRNATLIYTSPHEELRVYELNDRISLRNGEVGGSGGNRRESE